MSPLYVYALMAGEPEEPLGAGLAGEPLQLLSSAGLRVVAGDMAARPAPAPAALEAHDAVVRRLAERAAAVLPVRFGEWVEGEEALAERLAPRAASLAEALALVRGCVQMTLRVFGEPSQVEFQDPADRSDRSDLSEPAPGPGTRYLAARRREFERSRSLPEIEPLRKALQPLLRAERVRRQETGRLVGTAYHLVPREAAGAYLGTLQAVGGTEGRLPAGHRVAASGPWPPYAFGPEGLP
ncbi:MAG TPA: GvpL/GvpF family gas vesicle protein [Thermoanaerobaculia bacterium]|nr:GvpL/GvpF family gas vesicle protein [Thermoanaerobaculia bacterium]